MLRRVDFYPNPRELLEKLSCRNEYGAIFGFIHGSYVYKDSDFYCASYKEIQYFKSKKYIESEFLLKMQPPDIDIVVVAEDPKVFSTRLQSYVEEENILEKLNYFLTINVMNEQTFLMNLHSSDPAAIKRIIKFRKILPFGNINLLSSLISDIDTFITDLDYVVQAEYDERKEYLQKQLSAGDNKFKLTEAEYKELFPTYLKWILLGDSAGFPENREKIVFPHSMDLKERIDLDSGSSQLLR